MARPRARSVAFGLVAVLAAGGLALVLASELLYRKAAAYRDDEAIEARAGRFSGRDALRLLFVGDSFTAGSLSESDIGYWAYIGGSLRDAGEARPVETVSLALAGSPTPFHRRQVAAWLRESGQGPDYLMVISGANNPNSQELWTEYALSPEGRRNTTAATRALYGAPTGLRLVLLRTGRLLGRDLPPDPLRRDIARLDRYLSDHPEYARWIERRFAEELRALFALAREHGVTPLAGSYLSDPFNPVSRAVAAEEGVPYLDLSGGELEERFRDKGRMASDGWHLNDAGNRELARRWAAWFRTEVAR